ncbi:NAD(P)-dependent alcohol dehydrogenase [Lentibacillus sp. CBA3610]|uniref:NAD(P)-dependent alcohol dehydrogenase n=1 Tax=Lentibacillus sp. CBA3610 TaxID=2518176 RepID=UPI0015957915|nr:NAD(P)-dependent alcohol dehydrogenase [Lentibacillus sp. CBA3610]QKY70288.1 NAD(P)-dependent alcohol dehydrogenase [Lentibacillus sp. CBA3610]
MKTKAAVVNAVNDNYKFESLDLNKVGTNQVLVKMVASGVCQSDETFRIGKSEFPLPTVLGHEGAGIIQEVGSGVKNFEVGDQVVMAYDYCGHCSSCRTGYPSLCDHYNEFNVSDGPGQSGEYKFHNEDGTIVHDLQAQGAFSTYTVTNENNLIKVDKDADLRKLGPLGCGFLTGFGTITNSLKPETSSSIAIFGTGTVGLSALMTAVIEGCYPIIAVDIHDSRLEIAKELGATHLINSKNENLVERIDEISNGLGVNYSVDTTGVPEVIESSITVLAIGGESAPVAMTGSKTQINTTQELLLGARKIHGVKMGNAVPQLAIPKLIEYFKNGRFPFDKLLGFYRFEEINEAAADSSSGETIKPIIIIDEEYRKENPIEYKNQ